VEQKKNVTSLLMQKEEGRNEISSVYRVKPKTLYN